MEDLQKDKDQGEKLRSLVEVSRKNDIPALLNAKNRAQQDVYSDPSKENLAILERATAMLEKAMDAGQNCKTWKEALTYLQDECGRKIQKSKLFTDIKAGRLRKQPDGSFKWRDLDRYAASLPTAGTPDKLATDAARRQREKEEQEIRRIRVAADKEEFILKVKQGQYISRDDVYQELAARAVALSASLKTEFEARSLDVIALVEGNPKKSGPFVEHIEQVIQIGRRITQGRGAAAEQRAEEEPMTAQKWLEELERLVNMATPGPWAYEQHGDTSECGVGVILDDNNKQISGLNTDTTLFVADAIAPEVASSTDAAYIVAACNAVPRLVEMLRIAVSFIEAQNARRAREGEMAIMCETMQLLFTMTEPKE